MDRHTSRYVYLEIDKMAASLLMKLACVVCGAVDALFALCTALNTMKVGACQSQDSFWQVARLLRSGALKGISGGSHQPVISRQVPTTAIQTNKLRSFRKSIVHTQACLHEERGVRRRWQYQQQHFVSRQQEYCFVINKCTKGASL